MLVKSDGIVLQKIKYGDRKYMLKILTKKYGLLNFSAVTGKSANSKIKIGSILPLTSVEVCFDLKLNKEIQQVIEVNCIEVRDGISLDYSKLAIAQFLNEVLIKSIKEHTPNEELYDFIHHSYQWLNNAEKEFSDMHIFFLLELSKLLGFEPHNNYSESATYFDTREGRFTSCSLSFPLGFDADQSKLFSQALAGEVIKLPYSRNERSVLIECLMAFYRMHVTGFNEMKSLEVLKEIFN